MTKAIKVVYPVLDFEAPGCPIKELIDENAHHYKNLTELLDSLKTHTMIMFYFYEVVYYWFEREILMTSDVKHCWKTQGAHNARFSWIQSKITITRNSDPKVGKTRLKRNSYLIDLINISNYLPTRDPFPITEQDIKNDYAIVEELINIYQCFGRDDLPNSVAAMGRNIIHLKETPDDVVSQNILRICSIAYTGAIYYLDREGPVDKTLYNYDYRSMYSGIMTQQYFPRLDSAVEHDKFIPVDNHERLAIYHIKHMDVSLKSTGLPTLLNHQPEFYRAKPYLQEGSSSCYGMGNFQHLKTRGDGFPEDIMWITSLAFDLLVQNYEIKRLEIDKTIEFTKTTKGCTDSKAINTIFKIKETAKGHRRDAVKILLETMTGSLGMKYRPHKEIKLQYLSIKGEAEMEEEKDQLLSNFHWACFLNDWGRYLINQKFHKAGGTAKVHSVDTDGIWCFGRELDEDCGTGLCSLRLDATSFQSFWWGFRQYIVCSDPAVKWMPNSVEWEPHIQGLRKGYYKYGKEDFTFPTIRWNSHDKCYELRQQKYTLRMEEQYEE